MSKFQAILLLTLFCCTPAAYAETAVGIFERGYRYQIGDGVAQDLDLALELYGQALKIDPSFVQAGFNAGLIYSKKKDYELAARQFVKVARAVSLESGVREDSVLAALARNMLGTCMQKLGKDKQAEKQFRNAIILDRSMVEGHYNLINLLITQERLTEAQTALESADSNAPSMQYEYVRGRLIGLESRATKDSTDIKIAILVVVLAMALIWFYKRRLG